MIWSAFFFDEKSSLSFFGPRLNAIEYQSILSNYLLPFLNEIGHQNRVFMQDNAPIHKASSTISFLKDSNIEVLPWPAFSPDLNPIENLWGIISGKVYEGGRQYNSINELKKAIQDSWDQIGKNTLENLIFSINRRIGDVIYNHGNYIKY